MRYLVYQLERCPKSGKSHYQGYAEYKNQVSIKQSQKLLDVGLAHHEPRRGTPQEASDYCQKTESRIEPPELFGTMSKQGKRTDLEAVAKEIAEGKSVNDITLEDPMMYHQYGRTLQKLENIRVAKLRRTEDAICIVIWGSAGTGKSWKIQHEYPDAYLKSDNSWWWDGYNGQEVVYFDEYDNPLPIQVLKQLITGRAFQVQTKGGYTMMLAKKIIILANTDPNTWYPNLDPIQTIAFQRRLTEVYEVKGTSHEDAVYTRTK